MQGVKRIIPLSTPATVWEAARMKPAERAASRATVHKTEKGRARQDAAISVKGCGGKGTELSRAALLSTPAIALEMARTKPVCGGRQVGHRGQR